MKEAAFQKWVVDVATRFGWRCWHVPAPMRATRAGTWVGAKEAAGIPDLILMHDDPPRLVFAEVKGTGGKASDEQLEFLRMARDVSEQRRSGTQNLVGAYLWAPGDEQQIEDILKSRVLS